MHSARSIARTIAAAALLLAPWIAHGAEPAVTKVEREGSLINVQSRVALDAPASVCFGVLADFDHLAEFVPRMESSRVIGRDGEELLLRQTGRSKAAFIDFPVDVTLAVAVDPPRQIDFRRVAGNLRHMDGRWRVDGGDTFCSIRYDAAIETEFWVPPLLGPMLLRREVQDLIEAVSVEILRRAQGQP